MISLAHELFMSEHYPVTLTRVDVDIMFLGVYSDFRNNKLVTMLSLPDSLIINEMLQWIIIYIYSCTPKS